MPHVADRLLKITDSGSVFRDDLLTDGSVNEWRGESPDELWGGRWSRQAGRTRIVIGGNALLSRSASATAIESDPWGDEHRVFLLSVSDEVPALGMPRPISMVKQVRSDRAYFTTLMPDGAVSEFDLIEGVDSRPWDGRWWREGECLVVAVGGYTWRAEKAGDGWVGVETGGVGDHAVTGWLVGNRVEDVRGGLLARSELFAFNGYAFHDTARRLGGNFSNVLEVKKFAGERELSFAAKIVKTGMTAFQHRELDYLDQFSATDGLIAAIDSFDLPSSEEFGEHRDGHVIILEWGDTDAKRTITDHGAMSPVEAALLIADVSRALSAMHSKFHAIHADVKIDNIIGRRTGSTISWRLTDFNVTSDIDVDTGRAAFLGTTAICISPELQERMTARSPYLEPSDDIWAIGVVAAQALTGTVLPAGSRVDRDDVLGLVVGADPRVAELIDTCLMPARSRISAAELHMRALALASTFVSGRPREESRLERAVTGHEPHFTAAATVAETDTSDAASAIGLSATSEPAAEPRSAADPSVGSSWIVAARDSRMVRVDVTGYYAQPGLATISVAQLAGMIAGLERTGWFLTFNTADENVFLQILRRERDFLVRYQAGAHERHMFVSSTRYVFVLGQSIWNYLTGGVAWQRSLEWRHIDVALSTFPDPAASPSSVPELPAPTTPSALPVVALPGIVKVSIAGHQAEPQRTYLTDVRLGEFLVDIDRAQRFLTVHRDEGSGFIQVMRTATEYSLQYRREGAREEMGAAVTASAFLVRQIIWDFLMDGDVWETALAWRSLDDVRPHPYPRRGLLDRRGSIR